MEISFRLLQEVKGIYLTPEVCPPDYDITALEPHQKSSCFYLSYKDQLGNRIETEHKAWINDFQVDKEAGTGKCDFKYDLVLEDACPTV